MDLTAQRYLMLQLFPLSEHPQFYNILPPLYINTCIFSRSINAARVPYLCETNMEAWKEAMKIAEL